MLNRNQSKLYELHEQMQHCIVVKKVGQSTCYELYDEETNRFLVACVSCVLISPMLLFVTSQDCHMRKFEDICCNLNIRHFVAKMTPDWMTGLNYKLTGFDESILCEIKIKSPVLSSAPVSFTMRVPNPDFDPDDQPPSPPISIRPSSTKSIPLGSNLPTFSFLSCIQDVACLGEDPVPPKEKKSSSSTLYTSLSTTSQNQPMLELRTRKPVWNTELNQWTDHYGGRVKIPTRHNFMVLREGEGEGEFYRTAAVAPAMSGLEDQSLARMCIRHGKTRVNAFILDFRSPATALTAFAAVCAVHC